MKRVGFISLVHTLVLYSAFIWVGFCQAAGKPKPPPTPEPLVLTNSAIVYVDGASIKLADANGDNQATLVTGSGTEFWRPTWSPDGNTIIFTSDLEGPGIYRVRIDRSNGIVEPPLKIVPLTTVLATNPVWSPQPTEDGSFKIAFGDLDPVQWKFELNLLAVDETGEPIDMNGDGNPEGPYKLLTYPLPGHETFDEYIPSWSPDASKLAITTFDTTSGSSGIEVITLTKTNCADGSPLCEDFGTRRDLIAELPDYPFNIDGAWGPSWANNQSMIAANGIPLDGSNGEIWVIRFGDDPQVTPTDYENLTNTNPTTTGANGSRDGDENHPTWSPDDSQIMYQGFDYLCAPQKRNKRGFNLKIRNVNGTGVPDACEEKMIVEGGLMPNWWRGLQ